MYMYMSYVCSVLLLSGNEPVGVANLERTRSVSWWERDTEVHERFEIHRTMLTGKASQGAAKLTLEEREG